MLNVNSLAKVLHKNFDYLWDCISPAEFAYPIGSRTDNILQDPLLKLHHLVELLDVSFHTLSDSIFPKVPNPVV